MRVGLVMRSLAAVTVLALSACGSTSNNAGGQAVACVNGACANGLTCVNSVCVVKQLADATGAEDMGTADGETFINACETAKCASQIGLCAGGCATWLACAQKCAAADAACQTACAQKAASDTAAAASIQSVLQCVGASAPACTATVDAVVSSDAETDAAPDVTADANAPTKWPTWQLKDVNPNSAGFDTTYGLDTWAGKRVFVVLLSQADLQSEQFAADVANVASTSTAVVFIVNTTAFFGISNYVGTSAEFVDVLANQSIRLPNGALHQAQANDVFAYDVDGREMGLYEGKDLFYLSTIVHFFADVSNTPSASASWFELCPDSQSTTCQTTP